MQLPLVDNCRCSVENLPENHSEVAMARNCPGRRVLYAIGLIAGTVLSGRTHCCSRRVHIDAVWVNGLYALYMSRDMRFSTTWYVRPAVHIDAVSVNGLYALYMSRDMRFSTTWYVRPAVHIDAVSVNGLYALYMSRDIRFSTMWYVRPAKPRISLRIRAVWSEPLLVAWIFYEC